MNFDYPKKSADLFAVFAGSGQTKKDSPPVIPFGELSFAAETVIW